MKYLRILLAIACEPWALQRDKLATVMRLVQTRALGSDAAIPGYAKHKDEPLIRYISARDGRETAAVWADGRRRVEGLTTIENGADEAKLTPRQEQRIRESEGRIGIINVFGVISQRMSIFDEFSGGTSAEAITQAMRSLLNDNEVKAIIFNFDSPGGTVGGIEELGQEIFDSRGIKPMVAQVSGNVMSAAYWLASQTDEIVITPSGYAGSIGVYTIHEDISAFLEMNGVKETIIASSAEKIMGNEYEPLSDEAKAFLQERVSKTAEKFVEAVARGRNVTAEKVRDKYGNGLYFDSADSVKRGLVDRIGSLDDTLERFGLQMRPANNRKAQQRAEAKDAMVAKVMAGEPPDIRETENGLRALGLSKSQATVFAKRICSDHDRGEPDAGKSSAPEPVIDKQTREAIRGLAGRIAKLTVPKFNPKGSTR